MSYKLKFNLHAAKQFRKLPKNIQLRISESLAKLKDNPRPSGVKKLVDYDNYYRIRVGDYRVIYSIHDDIMLLLVVKLGHRKNIYD